MFVSRGAEGTEEYQRVTTNVGKGLAVIQEELHRMRMATKAQVDSLAIQREVTVLLYSYVCLFIIMVDLNCCCESRSLSSALSPLFIRSFPEGTFSF